MVILKNYQLKCLGMDGIIFEYFFYLQLMCFCNLQIKVEC